MPVQSKGQWGFLAANHPDLLHKWQHESPVNYKSLPQHKGGSKYSKHRKKRKKRKYHK